MQTKLLVSSDTLTCLLKWLHSWWRFHVNFVFVFSCSHTTMACGVCVWMCMRACVCERDGVYRWTDLKFRGALRRSVWITVLMQLFTLPSSCRLYCCLSCMWCYPCQKEHINALQQPSISIFWRSPLNPFTCRTASTTLQHRSNISLCLFVTI